MDAIVGMNQRLDNLINNGMNYEPAHRGDGLDRSNFKLEKALEAYCKSNKLFEDEVCIE